MNRKAKFKTGIQFKLDRNKHKLRQFLGDFARQEDGVMLAFVLFLLLIMMTVGGVSVDLMRAEMERTREWMISWDLLNPQSTADKLVDTERQTAAHQQA